MWLSHKTVSLEDDSVKIELARKRVRNLRISISRDGKVNMSIPFFASERQAIAFAESKIEWIKKTIEKVKKLPPLPNFREIEISQEEIAELRRLITTLIPEWEFRLGVSVKEWNLRKMKSRWGSCKTTTGKITFSTTLAKKSLRCVEYVVAHELAHLLVPNHSKKFYAVIERHLPFWREARKELNCN
ncbi:zinc metalloprotease [Fibrobacterales bacterium]|nr:zinc metalloprotease [Fibrobacterales bacterium]